MFDLWNERVHVANELLESGHVSLMLIPLVRHRCRPIRAIVADKAHTLPAQAGTELPQVICEEYCAKVEDVPAATAVRLD